MDYKYETDHFPLIRARWFTRVSGKRKVRLIVIHSAETRETVTAAENVARYFKNLTGKKASAHICVDSNNIVQSVFDNNVAYAAPGANHDGIQIELAGYAKQTTKQWLDAYGALLIENAANATAQYCLKYSIPQTHLTNQKIKAGNEGIVGHNQVSSVYKRSSHTDPGKGFPWKFFIDRVKFHYKKRKNELDKN